MKKELRLTEALKHANKVANKFKRDMVIKYLRGAKEHGGKLWEKPTYRYMWEELLDHVVYHAVFMDHIDEIIKILEKASSVSTPQGIGYMRLVALDKAVKEVLNILKTGNKEGEVPEGD